MAEDPDARLGVDVGGTFTDVVLATGAGEVVTAKVPTTDPQDDGVLEGVRAACSRAGVDPANVSEFTHATTVTVNALLENEGARTALVTTEGFRDVLEIGRQDRPSLYDHTATKPAPLVPRDRRFEIEERTDPDGVETLVDPDAIRALAADVRAVDAESVAVCLLHAYADETNESTVVDVLDEELSVPVAGSADVVGEFREYERTSTTVVDAAVRPVLTGYLGRLVDAATDAGLPAPLVMQGNGGVASATAVRAHPVTTLLSGPAAGVVGANAVAGDVTADGDTDALDGGPHGLAGLVTVDMGGTSTDVSLVSDGDIARTPEQAIGGYAVRSPMVDVRTVGAGGGSIAWIDDGGALRVGPHSAGADPGPACYGRGGSDPTLTDAALALGYLGSAMTLGGGADAAIALDAARATAALDDLAERAGFEDASDRSGAVAAAAGVYRVAVATTARAVRSMTVERGHDPREHALVAFGGAGPMIACQLARELGVSTVLVPPVSGVLSAYGLLAADETHDAARTIDTALGDADPDRVTATFEDLMGSVLEAVREPEQATVSWRADCRYVGQRFELSVDVGTENDLETGADGGDGSDAGGVDAPSFDPARVTERFHDVHESTYGYRMDEPVDLVTLRVSARTPRQAPSFDAGSAENHEDARVEPIATRTARFHTESIAAESVHETPVFERASLPEEWSASGPVIVEGAESTAVVPPSWSVLRRADGALVLTVEDAQPGGSTDATEATR